ncbi:type II toxin-antitoxin system HicB family antitoxin [bacterium]|nr:type II toxin-antitoxin system HicB family antitoxin [bacterium]
MKNKTAYLINILWSEEDQCYIAEVPELEGCITHGKTSEQALKHVHQAIESWIMAAKKLKHPIPKPALMRKASGKFNVRLPQALHKDLIIRATREKVSLNQMVTTLLAKGL